ncbi:hypothetical protein [Methanogenium cariaci]|uniref:hypothetical protein n=1 Tax=Methanogenium cariaci TaxID=2197 RepID=UPI0012F6AF34|nr:hypothetical protein [Methanogenium cariaci]
MWAIVLVLMSGGGVVCRALSVVAGSIAGFGKWAATHLGGIFVRKYGGGVLISRHVGRECILTSMWPLS